MNNKVLYTSDLHGNEAQFRTLVEHALQIKPSTIIIGGDLPPKEEGKDFIGMQRKFLRDKLPILLGPIKEQLPQTKIYLIPGNDDCAINDDVLDYCSDLFMNIDGRRLALPNGLEIVGYSTVPITPFGIKDREKFDLTEIPTDLSGAYVLRQKETYRLNGAKSTTLGWKEFSFTDADRKDSIQHDLESELFTRNPSNTIYVFHTPANNTALDIIEMNMHVGSFAVRQFIEKYQPYLTLHGHVHETVYMSGSYKEQIGNSCGMSAGNHNGDSKLSVLVFDINNPMSAERIRLPCTKYEKIFGKFF